MPIKNKLKASCLTLAGVTASLVTLTMAEPSQAMGFGALDTTNSAFLSPFITSKTPLGGTIVDFGTIPSVLTSESPNSVTVNVGSFGKANVPVVGGGIFYQATQAGTVSFDWTFANAGSQDFFAYTNLGRPQDIQGSIAGLLTDPTLLKNLPTNTSQQLPFIVSTLLTNPTLLASLSSNPQATLGKIYDAFDHDDLQYGNGLNQTLYPGGIKGQAQTITFDVKEGDIFGFAAGLAADKLKTQGSREIGSFTLANSSFKAKAQSQKTTPTDVPTPAAVLPVLGGLCAAARRRMKGN